MAVREIEWPRDVARLAASLARAASPAGGWFWLDGEAEGGSSYLGVAEELRIAERGLEREFLAGLRRGGSRLPDGADGSRPADGSGDLGLHSGWVLALGYEFGVALLGLEPQPDEAAPAFALGTGVVLALEHGSGRAELRGPSEAAIDAWLGRHGGALRAAGAGGRGVEAGDPPAPARWRSDEGEYLAAVEACREAIHDGEAYVICLTDTATAPGGGIDPLGLFERLRGATRGGVLVAGDRALVSMSPERFLSVRGDTVATHPIKGTRSRGGTPEQDEALARALAADPKERSENLMIVDLMRNDLSRVCTPGSVAASSFLRVESHPHVHQLVSTVEGELAPGRDVYDAIEACLPGGSMTGAPKRRAVELLAGLEHGPRGLYSGCFGWIDDGGDAELAMTIRSIELRGAGSAEVEGEARTGAEARVGAGGGITFDSDPASEQAEKLLKAAPLLAALAAAGGRSR